MTFRWSEPVVGFTASCISAAEHTLDKLSSDDGQLYTATVTPGAVGMVELEVVPGCVSDADGNTNVFASNRLEVRHFAEPLAPTLSGKNAVLRAYMVPTSHMAPRGKRALKMDDVACSAGDVRFRSSAGAVRPTWDASGGLQSMSTASRSAVSAFLSTSRPRRNA